MEEKRKTGFVGFKTTPTEKADYEADAEKAGMSLSAYTREALDEKAGRRGKKQTKDQMETALLKAARKQRSLLPDLLTLATSASRDRRVRQLVRAAAALAPDGRASKPQPTAQSRSVASGGAAET